MVRFSPKEVSAALSSSNRAEALEMKNTLKRFQAFLKKFEVLTYSLNIVTQRFIVQLLLNKCVWVVTTV